MLKPGRSPNKIISFLQPQLSLVFSMLVKIGSIWAHFESLLRSDNTALREFLQFKRVLNRWAEWKENISSIQDFPSIFCRFKDCVKTGDGIRAKKSSLGLARLTGSGREELTNKLTNLERGELANLGRGEMNNMGRGEMITTGRGEEWQTGNSGMAPRFWILKATER